VKLEDADRIAAGLVKLLRPACERIESGILVLTQERARDAVNVRAHGTRRSVPMRPNCTIPNCSRPIHARGWCNEHYDRWQRKGDPSAALPFRRRAHGAICEVPDCGRAHDANGFCTTHNYRLKRHGDVQAHNPIKANPHGLSIAERFWAKVDRSGGPDACWPWLASIGTSGYGQFAIGRRDAHTMRGAHTVAYELDRGHPPPPDRPYVLHSCDNPPCCNPGHLSEGTQAENLADMRAKGRR
jgi:hypothetical protein